MGDFFFVVERDTERHKGLLAGWTVVLMMIIVGLPLRVCGASCFQGACRHGVTFGGPGKELIMSPSMEGLEKCCVIRETW